MNQLTYGPFISRKQAAEKGLKRYFTGPCQNGHQGWRLVSDKKCNVCASAKATARNKKRADSDPVFRSQRIQSAVEWRRNNPEARATIRNRHESQASVKAVQSIRALIRNSIHGRGCAKTSKTAQLLGCSVQFARDYLESLFADGMSWGNHGDWHIDHIRPVASFENPADPACWHYSNLQPLWASDNLRKGASWEPLAN